MNEEIRSYSNDSQQKSAIFALLLELVIAVFIIVSVLIGLNYFNIISLERVHPVFSLLPSQYQELTEEVIESEEARIPEKIMFAPCPLGNVDECKKGAAVDEGSSFKGIGYSDLPAGSEIRAVMSGDIEFVQEEGVYTITISSGAQGQRAVYSFADAPRVDSDLTSVNYLQPLGTVAENVSTAPYDLKIGVFIPAVNEFVELGVSEKDGSFVQLGTQ